MSPMYKIPHTVIEELRSGGSIFTREGENVVKSSGFETCICKGVPMRTLLSGGEGINCATLNFVTVTKENCVFSGDFKGPSADGI
jgi:hypothetical protein